MKKFLKLGLWMLILAIPAFAENYVRVSQENPHYLELSDGTPYLPIGVNLCVLRDTDKNGNVHLLDDHAALERIAFYFQKLHENGGNYCRIWLGMPPFEIETSQAGHFDATRIANIEKLLELAKKYGIYVKFCVEHFRTLEPRVPYAFGVVTFGKPIYKTNPPSNMTEFLNGEVGQAYYRARCAKLAEHFKNHPNVFGWELWNEVNCVPGGLDWTEKMLPSIHALFPNHLVFQSLGSYDSNWAPQPYERLVNMPGNDLAQVHRYLDPGAKLDVCRGPMDVLAADSVRALRKGNVAKPILSTELGAVQANHAGPSLLYPLDKEGLLLHDILFAPFFSGAAGSGHCWHWNVYIEKNDLWWQIGRFTRSIAGVNPIAEKLEPFYAEAAPVRIYGLKGKKSTLVWLRDSEYDWQRELLDKQPAVTRENLSVSIPALEGKTVTAYDPWLDRDVEVTQDGKNILLPKFRRSIILRAK
ncbi:MAG: cellulase family glycosylhydrolase [Planctomycetia bacterium]|nr:cellulase family glycosylhydrolase [Planctomycetia bacterium]